MRFRRRRLDEPDRSVARGRARVRGKKFSPRRICLSRRRLCRPKIGSDGSHNYSEKFIRTLFERLTVSLQSYIIETSVGEPPGVV